MARVTAGECNAAQISPEISDDEVFVGNSVWRPLRTNGFPSEISQETLQNVPLENNDERQKFVNIPAAQRQTFDVRMHSREYSQDTISANNIENCRKGSESVTLATNTNNNRPGGVCSSVVQSGRSEYDRTRSENVQSESYELQCRRPQLHTLERQQSIVDGLLFEIYDRWHGNRTDSFDSDTFTECSSTSEVFHSRWDSYCETAAEQPHARQFHRSFLENQSITHLKRMVQDLQRSIGQMSTRLVRQLKRRDRRLAKLSRNSDVVTAILQAASLKRQIDTRMKFSVAPPPGQSAFDQWKDAMKAVNRLPMGLPPEFRKKVWLSLADHYIRKLKIDWHKTVRLAFNERSNPDDDKLGMQIVKDLHRTGCSSFSGQDNEQDRAVLKRVLLAYARWNKRIGYCQGFNVIAALLLNVMERKEDDALKVMIYLVDHVLPESYFDNNLRALSVDMAVFRDLLRLTLPTLSRHLDRLQHAAQDINTGACYEPPLTNVFTMQWFLTLFATCLPKEVVLRVWDAILLEGSEVLLRTALCLWGKLARRIMKVDSADEFYSLMGELSSNMMEGSVFNSDDMIKAVYAIAPFPFPQLTELREKYTYNIRPFSSAPAPSRKASRMAKAMLYSDEDEPDEEELRAITSLPGMSPVQGNKGKGTDISLVGPGAYGAESELLAGGRDSMYMERMTTDITALKMQYDKLRQRQRQAHVIIAAAASAKKAVEVKQKSQAPVLVPKIESPLAMNHLFVGKVQGGRNRLVTDGPRIAAPRNSLLTKQLQAVAAAQAASRSKLSPGKHPSASRNSPSALQSAQTRQPEMDNKTSADTAEGEERLSAGEAIHSLSADLTSGNHNMELEQGSAGVEDGGVGDGGVEEDETDLGEHPVSVRKVSESCPEPVETSDTHMSNMDDDGSSQSSGDESMDHLFSLKQLSEDVNYATVLKSGDAGVSLCQQTSLSLESKERDSGVVVSSSSCGGSSDTSPEKTPHRPDSIQLWPQCSHSGEDSPDNKLQENREKLRQEVANGNSPGIISCSTSACNGIATTQVTITSVPTPATTPTHKHRESVSAPSTPNTVSLQVLSSPSHPPPLSSPIKTSRPFNPFPVKHVNTNRAKTGLKLGLYTPSTLQHIQGQLLGGMVGKKARNASS